MESDNIKLTGKVIKVESPQTFGTKGFRKATCVIETGDKFPQKIPIEASGKKADMFADAGIEVGDTVTFSVNIQGRESNGRFFLSLSAWKGEIVSKVSGQGSGRESASDTAGIPDFGNELDDEIQF